MEQSPKNLIKYFELRLVAFFRISLRSKSGEYWATMPNIRSSWIDFCTAVFRFLTSATSSPSFCKPWWATDFFCHSASRKMENSLLRDRWYRRLDCQLAKAVIVAVSGKVHGLGGRNAPPFASAISPQ